MCNKAYRSELIDFFPRVLPADMRDLSAVFIFEVRHLTQNSDQKKEPE